MDAESKYDKPPRSEKETEALLSVAKTSELTLAEFIDERNRIMHRKDNGESFPWTDDPILQRYFISNIDCEDDKTTRWLKTNWRAPYEDDPDLWFALSVFRRGLNLPTSAGQLGYPVPWNPDKFMSIAAKGKFYNTSAYRMQVGHRKQDGGFHGTQAEMLVHYVFNPLWEKKESLRPIVGQSCEAYFNRLSAAKWMGGWYAYRVICDLKHTKWLRDASDWWTWLDLGPGTLRGLNRLMGRPVDTGMIHKKGVLITASAAEKASYKAEINQLRGAFSAQVFGGALCEWDKYERIRLGERSSVRPYRHDSVSLSR